MLSNPLSLRTTSTHPVSIGTSILLESIVRGKHPPYDDTKIIQHNLKPYTAVALNVHTLCRNILSACKSNAFDGITSEHLYAELRSEITYMAEVLKPLFKTVVFYYCEYKNIQSVLKTIHHLGDNTDKQKKTTQLITDAVSTLVSVQSELPNSDCSKVVVYKNNFEPPSEQGLLIVTAQPYNLVAVPKTIQCGLLESHTAKLKSRPLWYSKLKMASQLPWMPFNVITLQIFGDGAMLAPYSKPHRDYTIQVGEYFKWDTNTTVDRIRLNISLDRTNPLRHDLLDLM